MNYLNYIPKFEIPSNKLTYYFPIEHARADEAEARGMTVEQLLALEKAQAEALKNQGVAIADKGDAYQNKMAAIKGNPKELQRQEEGKQKAYAEAGKAANAMIGLTMPSGWWNLTHLDNQLTEGQAAAMDIGAMALLGGAGLVKGVVGKKIAQKEAENAIRLPNRYYIKVPGQKGHVNYTLYNANGSPAGQLKAELPVLSEEVSLGKGTRGTHVEMVNSFNGNHGVSEDLYNVTTKDALHAGHPGMESGQDLQMEKLTKHVTSKFPHNEELIGTPQLVKDESGYHFKQVIPGRMLTGTTSKPLPMQSAEGHFIQYSEPFRKPKIESLAFFERPSNLTEGERLGIPKHERKELGDFKSELDWTPREWMKANLPNEFGNPYSAYDAMSLQSHVPEYLKIEKQLKTSGNYDPSKFYDPRSYIQLQSKVANNLSSPIYSGVKTPEISATYNGPFWGTYGQDKISGYQARAYGISDDHTLQLAVPKDAKTFTFDANKKHWHSLEGEGLTNDLVERKFTEGFDRVDINNVIDAGKNSGNIGRKSKFQLFPNLIDEQIMPMVPQNDVIINKYVPRKSIIGNNGNFNLEDLNIYRKSGGKLNYLNYINNVGRTI